MSQVKPNRMLHTYNRRSPRRSLTGCGRRFIADGHKAVPARNALRQADHAFMSPAIDLHDDHRVRGGVIPGGRRDDPLVSDLIQRVDAAIQLHPQAYVCGVASVERGV